MIVSLACASLRPSSHARCACACVSVGVEPCDAAADVFARVRANGVVRCATIVRPGVAVPTADGKHWLWDRTRPLSRRGGRGARRCAPREPATVSRRPERPSNERAGRRHRVPKRQRNRSRGSRTISGSCNSDPSSSTMRSRCSFTPHPPQRARRTSRVNACASSRAPLRTALSRGRSHYAGSRSRNIRSRKRTRCARPTARAIATRSPAR